MNKRTPPFDGLARHSLEGLLPRGTTVYVNLRSVSASGMLRRVSVHCVSEGRIRDITGLVSLALGWNRDRTSYIPIRGCGFSPATHLVCALGYALHLDEYSLDPQSL